MAAGDLITTPWQVELGGLLLGEGTDFVVRRFDPWKSPTLRSGETARVGANGVRGPREWFAGRQVVVDLYVTGADDATEAANLRALRAAFAPTADELLVPLVWMEDDGALYRLQGRPRLADPRVEPRIPTECRFLAYDPLIYSNTLSEASTRLAEATGGLSFAAAAPFVFGTSGSSAVMACPNAGTYPTSWVATFTGPLTAPELVHQGSGKRLSLSGAVIAAGETLVVDSDAQTVLLNGTASRYGWLAQPAGWFDLVAGENSVQLLGSSGSGSVSIEWRSAWI